MRKWIFLAALALTTIFCSVNLTDTPAPATQTPDLAAMVNATLTAVAAATTATTPPTVAAPDTETPAPVEPAATSTLSTTPTSSLPDRGIITGTLSYPSEAIPPLRIAAFNVTTGEASYTDTAAGQSTYAFELAVGTYHVVAYTLDGSFAGGYSQAVPCGLAVECADHSLIPVTVTSGMFTFDIDPGDWYAPEGSFPPMPTH